MKKAKQVVYLLVGYDVMCASHTAEGIMRAVDTLVRKIIRQRKKAGERPQFISRKRAELKENAARAALFLEDQKGRPGEYYVAGYQVSIVELEP